MRSPFALLPLPLRSLLVALLPLPLRSSLVALLPLLACSSAPPAPPPPEILPCYRTSSYQEFAKLSAKRAKSPNTPLVVKGKKFACVESSLEVQSVCYETKSRKEYARLSALQEKTPAWPVKVSGKYYRCLQQTENKRVK